MALVLCIEILDEYVIQNVKLIKFFRNNECGNLNQYSAIVYMFNLWKKNKDSKEKIKCLEPFITSFNLNL